jgi:hypothetical protein
MKWLITNESGKILIAYQVLSPLPEMKALSIRML